jgi:chemotaxis protein CheD
MKSATVSRIASPGSGPLEQYFDRTFNCQATKLLPGQYHVASGNELLVTTLGSCVSACLFDEKLGVGGMNHFMLPSSERSRGKIDESSARLGIHAMELLINAMIQRGARRGALRAKLFGGGAVLAGMTTTNVGEQNAEFARTYLKTEGIPVLAEDLLDVYPRKVYFFPRTGRVLVRKLRGINNETIESRERAYAEQLRRGPTAGGVEIFS